MIEIKELRFGTAGIPIRAKGKSTEEGIKEVRNLNLDAMELEFVHSVNISKERAPSVRKIAEENDIILTTHGQYYINLNAKEIQKVKASQYRILNAVRIAYLCGAYSVCFHPGYYFNMDKRIVYEKIKKAIEEVVETLKEENVRIWIRPETTGKHTQFGNLEELIAISKEIDMVLPCIDFSHLHARTNGKMNTYDEIIKVLEFVEKELGKYAINNMHIHISGIDYSEKGEKEHLNLRESDLNFREILKAWKDFGIRGIVICESPNIEEDAMLLKKTYLEL